MFEVKQRELLFDFLNDYALSNEDDIIYESNEEFSMLVNSSPVWFSFDDLSKFKEIELAFKN